MSYYAFEGKPDDDSVRHAWHTCAVRAWVDVDEGIAPVVEALNALPDIRTFASCQGHEHSDHERRGYVYVGWRSPTGLAALEEYAKVHGYTLEQWGAHGAANEDGSVVLFLPAAT